MADEPLIIDERRSGNMDSSTGTFWHLVTDGVTGACPATHWNLCRPIIASICECRLTRDRRTTGVIVPAALDIEEIAASGLSAYTGIVINVYGNAAYR